MRAGVMCPRFERPSNLGQNTRFTVRMSMQENLCRAGLISMFQCYGIDMRQLRELGTKEFSIMDAEHIRLPVRVDASGSLSA